MKFAIQTKKSEEMEETLKLIWKCMEEDRIEGSWNILKPELKWNKLEKEIFDIEIKYNGWNPITEIFLRLYYVNIFKFVDKNVKVFMW